MVAGSATWRCSVTAEILLAVGVGLLVNELYDLSSWWARKLVRWSASRRYSDRARAEARAEELAAVIIDRPGSLFKLVTAIGFVSEAALAATRRTFSRDHASSGRTGASATDIAHDTLVKGGGLSLRQRTILSFIRDYSNTNGCAPSHRDIAEGVGLGSRGSVSYHLKILRAGGYITYEEGLPRTIRLLSAKYSSAGRQPYRTTVRHLLNSGSPAPAPNTGEAR